MLRRSERIAAQNQLLNKNSGNSSNPSPSLPKTSAPAKKTLLRRKPGGQVQYPSSVHIVGKSVLVNCCDNKRHGSASSSDYEKRISRSSTVSSCDSYNRKDHAPEPSPRKKLPLLLLLLLHILLLCIPLFAIWLVFGMKTEFKQHSESHLEYVFRLKNELMQQKAELMQLKAELTQQSKTNSGMATKLIQLSEQKFRVETEVMQLLEANQEERNRHHKAVSRLKNEVLLLLDDNQKQRNDIAQALRLYSEDRTGLVDYALKSTGAKVINTGDTETYGTCFPRLWCYYHAEAILEPDVSRGNCWAFKGHKGSATIQLPVTIRPTGFSVEHIPKSMSPTGRIDNAPKDFSVYGLDNPNDKLETLLGKFTYDQNGTPVQTFFIQPKDVKTYKIIELRVESNWGNPTHTCVYRFRVHGDLQK